MSHHIRLPYGVAPSSTNYQDSYTPMAHKFRNTLLILLASLTVFLLGRALWRALASPQTKIRWRIESMVDGFNAMRAQPVLDGVTRDFRDQTGGGTSRDDLRQILAWLFLNEIDSQGEFNWTCEFDPTGLAVVLAPERGSAEVQLSLRLLRSRAKGEDPKLFWEAHLAGTVTKGDDGWQWSQLTTANHEERKRL